MEYLVIKEVCETLIRLGYVSTELEVHVYDNTICIHFIGEDEE